MGEFPSFFLKAERFAVEQELAALQQLKRYAALINLAGAILPVLLAKGADDGHGIVQD